MNFNNEYLEDILVRLAQNSSAIEGNTYTLSETVTIILHNKIPSNNGKTDKDVREFYEIANHKPAFDFILDCINNKQDLTGQVIKDMHALLMDRLIVDRGQYKTHSNAIKGATVQTTPPELVEQSMVQLLDNLDYRLSNAKTNEEKIEAILDTHIQFEIIHPFSDGNGRTGRMMMNYSLLQNNFAPLIIQANEKAEYYRILDQQDVKGFLDYARPLLGIEQDRMISFQNKENMQIKFTEQTIQDRITAAKKKATNQELKTNKVIDNNLEK